MDKDFDLGTIEGFEWDQGNLSHVELHTVSSVEAESVFKNQPFLVSPDLKHSEAEERFQALGLTNSGRFLFISFTIRHQKIRIISARDLNKGERKKLLQIGGESE